MRAAPPLCGAVSRAALGSLLVISACSSGSEDPAPAAGSGSLTTTAVLSTTTSAVIEPSDAAVVDAAALGAGWLAVDDTPSVEAADAQLAEHCPSIARRRAAHGSVRRERVRLQFVDRPLPTISDDLIVLENASSAADVFNAFASNAMLRCLPAVTEAAGLSLGGVRTERTPVAAGTGDAASAIRLHGTSIAGGVASQVTVELLIIQRGPALHLLVATSSDLYPLADAARTALIDAAAA